MTYTNVVISDNEVHICELAAENKPGQIVEILTGIEARKHIWELEKEFEAYIEDNDYFLPKQAILAP